MMIEVKKEGVILKKTHLGFESDGVLILIISINIELITKLNCNYF